MGFFDLFRTRKKIRYGGKRRSRRSVDKLEESFEEARVDIDALRAQTQTINATMEQHSKELSEHKGIIDQHSARLSSLEQVVNRQPANPELDRTNQVNRPGQTSGPALAMAFGAQQSSQKLNVNYFSEQEKRILAVFFQNQGMALSYLDVARALNKSPYTVKNQMNRMRLKADLFDRTIGDQSRNRFKLKDGLKVERYLNVG